MAWKRDLTALASPRGGLQPGVRLAAGIGMRDATFRAVLPFRRSWPAIAILLALDLAFLLPAIGTFREAAGEWARFESLFDLVSAVFLSAWLLGWSVAPLLMSGVLLLMLLGREVVRAGPGGVAVHLGLPGLGVETRYDPAAMRNLRLETPPPRSGDAWRGPHLAFDYGGGVYEIGSDLEPAGVAALKSGMERATGQAFARRAASPADAAPQVAAPGPATLGPAPEVAATTPARPAPRPLPGSVLALLLANLVPLLGTLLWGWRLADVMVLYWAESAVIGLFNLARLAVIDRWLALATGTFFLAHYSGFMAVHFLFLYGIFIEGPRSFGGGDLAAVAGMFRALWPALLALFLSHGFSFWVNFIGRQEYRGRSSKDQMREPYGRIVFMHLVLIIGGGVSLALGDTTPVLWGVIALKTALDVVAHLRQHRRAADG